MAVRISITGAGGLSVRIDAASRGEGADVRIAVGPSDVSIEIEERPDVLAQYTRVREPSKRRPAISAKIGVTAEMEAAAVSVFLAGADVAKLGRSLAAVYEAMEAARLGGDDA